MDDWEKLSDVQKYKVQNLCGNNWEDIEVYLQDFDDREGSEHKLNYGTILIMFKINGKEFDTTISQQCSGHSNRKSK